MQMDSFGRQIDYLRVSVTDRCNERCLYCYPSGPHTWQPREEILSYEEIARVVRVAAGLGFRKFRLTGGEPLARSDLPALVRHLAAIPGVEWLGMSTNATRLAPLAGQLKLAGLRTVNVSLDALDPAVYRRITGGQVDAALAGVRAAVQAGFERVKLNCVLLRGVNEDQLWPLIRFAAANQLPLRLIELMPTSKTGILTNDRFLGAQEVMQELRRHDRLIPQPDRRIGFGPARYYCLEKSGALIGFIGAMTNQRFCENCNRMRLTADGMLRPCLGNHGELDLRSLLRADGTDEALQAAFALALKKKPERHRFGSCSQVLRQMIAIGG
jgi:cyclic pyranopterin phosphate synthase